MDQIVAKDVEQDPGLDPAALDLGPGFDLLLDEIPAGGLVQNPPLRAEIVRPLEEKDLVVLETTKVGSRSAPLKRIREVHHQAARLLATGMKAVEVSAVVGMCQSRLSILQSDPAFAELVSFYSEREDARFSQVQDRMVALGLDATAELHERIVEDPASVSNKDLTEIMKASLDRGGHSPVHRSVSASTSLSAEELARIKAEVASAQAGTVIDVTAEEAEGGEETLPVPEDPGAEVGAASPGRSETEPTPEAPARLPGGGDSL